MTEWRPCVPAGTYEISDDGRVRRAATGRVLSSHWSEKNYLRVNISQVGLRKVHLLVAQAFLGPRPSPKHHCAHINGDPRDNRASNLKWATVYENNYLDKVRHGTFNPPPHVIGEQQGRAKLTDEKVRQIRKLASAGRRTRDLAVEFGVSQAAICQAVNRKTWRHVA